MASDLLEPNPFAKPIIASKGDSAAAPIYTAMGLSLDRWEHCEVSFGTLYSSFVEPPEGNFVLMRSFGTISAAATRREMILNACDAFFFSNKNDDLRARTRHILNLYKDASARRNEIAHSVVMGTPIGKVINKEWQLSNTEWFLFPPIFATRKTDMHWTKPKYKYTTNEISHLTKCFEHLQITVSALSHDVRLFRSTLREKP